MVVDCRREVRLTAREREVLSNPALGWETKHIAEELGWETRYIAEGLGWETRYIAEGLGVSWYTARNHIENLRTKLGASSRLEAVMVAMRLGIPPSE